MQEVTHIMTLEFTMVAKGPDAEVADFLEHKETISSIWLNAVRNAAKCDDVQLVKDQVFVRDVED